MSQESLVATSGQARHDDGAITISFGYLDENAELQRVILDVTEFAEILARDLLIADVERADHDEEEA